MNIEVIEKYLLEIINDAFNNGKTEITILAYDVYKKFNLKGEVPDVCNAMQRVTKQYNYLLRYSSPSGYTTKYCVTYYKNDLPNLDIKQEFYNWFKEQKQLKYPDKEYAEPTIQSAVELLERGCTLVYDNEIIGYKDLNIFAIDKFKSFNDVYENLFPYAENYDKSAGHRDFRNGLDFYKKFLYERESLETDDFTLKVKEIIKDYKKHFNQISKEEIYKWEAIKHFQDNFDIDAKNFMDTYKLSFSKAYNLLDSNMYYPYSTMIKICSKHGEEERNLFKQLYDESKSISSRIKTFVDENKRLAKDIGNSYQDVRAVAVYLTFRYPEKYYLYKSSIREMFINHTGYPERNIDEDAKLNKYYNYIEMLDKVNSVVQKDQDLIDMHKSRLSNDLYQDQNNKLLTADLVYYIRKKADYWPSLSYYNPNISKYTFLQHLSDHNITSNEMFDMLKHMFELGGETTCYGLAKIYGESASYYDMLATNYAKKLQMIFNYPICIDNETNEKRYFPILFVGRYIKEDGEKHYSWKMRDELYGAMKDIINMGFKEKSKEDKQMKDIDINKNTILYGPPGTGKTYNTVIYAVAIIENKEVDIVKEEAKQNYANVLNRYNEYKKNNQIDFITFHQSFGYEEFIEGIKPLVDEEKDIVKYNIQNGIFKEFCEKAQSKKIVQNNIDLGLNDSPNIWKVSLEHAGENPIRTYCMKNGCIRVGWDMYGENLEEVNEYSYGGKFILDAFYNKMQIGDIVISCYTNTTTDAIGVITGDVEWHDEFNNLKRLRKVDWIVKDINEDILAINNGKYMMQGTVYKLNIKLDDILNIVKNKNNTTVVENDKKYVFIIDEINRGNISKIFGELITLIEDTKRKGAKEAMSVTLPYSKTQFSVPNNVYILGTMNTADRSIAHIDTALRRRFDFKEMMPNTSLLKGIMVGKIDIEKVLNMINDRIAVLYDREHTIGHAYFMDLIYNPKMEYLADIFKNRVIPLLQEYFFEDYEKIRLVLGDNNKAEGYQFIKKTENISNDLFFGNRDIDIEDSYTYIINSDAFENEKSYIGIYEELGD